MEVFRPLRLAVFSTGDEIVDDPSRLGPGKIMNINGPMLALLARQSAMDVVIEALLPTIARRPSRLSPRPLSRPISWSSRAACRPAIGILSARPWPMPGLRVHFSAVAVKPGRPLTFATRPGAAVFGLPGNPVSVYVMFHVFVAAPPRGSAAALGPRARSRSAWDESSAAARSTAWNTFPPASTTTARSFP